MSGKHTPGPWMVEIIGSPRVVAEGAKGGPFPICDLRGWGYLTGKGHGALGLPHDEAVAIQNANTHLIAAAPDLLEAAVLLEKAEEAHANCDECGGEEVPELCPRCFPLFDDARLKRRAAIAKAEGHASPPSKEGE